jgi:hypothetical protein
MNEELMVTGTCSILLQIHILVQEENMRMFQLTGCKININDIILVMACIPKKAEAIISQDVILINVFEEIQENKNAFIIREENKHIDAAILAIVVNIVKLE